MQIIAIQLDTVWEDKAANRTRIRQLLAVASPPPGALIVVPEMFDTGFSMQLSSTAQSQARESEEFLRELASRFQCAVMGGVIGPLESGDPGTADSQRLASNEAVAFAPSGELLVRYRKMQPFSKAREALYHRPGDRHELFHWQDTAIAPFICYDLRFPEVMRPAAVQGAELMIVIACWPAVRSEHWVRLLQARAIENQCVTIGVNRCGSEPGLTFDGRSCGFDFMGNKLFETDGREQVVQIDVDVAAIRGWRDEFPALRDVRRELIPALQPHPAIGGAPGD